MDGIRRCFVDRTTHFFHCSPTWIYLREAILNSQITATAPIRDLRSVETDTDSSIGASELSLFLPGVRRKNIARGPFTRCTLCALRDQHALRVPEAPRKVDPGRRSLTAPPDPAGSKGSIGMQ